MLSLDVFRGITIAAMIIVNNPGTWAAIFAPLEHAEWNGITPTDFIFPFFLFIVGIAIPFSLEKLLNANEITNAVYIRVFRRAAIIFALGILMTLIPKFDFTHLRIFGVLQRIAICYLIASLLFLKLKPKQLAILSIVALLLYWVLIVLVPVPGCEIPNMADKTCNLASWIDRTLLTENHIWKQGKVFDPEGILSTIPAIVTTVFGIFTGLWLRSDRKIIEKAGGILFSGVTLCAIGWVWALILPFNKSLWTSSYVVYTSGFALCFLGGCIWLVDVKHYTRWAYPFRVFGMNALAVFVLSGFLTKCLVLVKWQTAAGKTTSLYTSIYKTFFAPLASPKTTSLLFALGYLAFWYLIMWVLYKKNIFVKV